MELQLTNSGSILPPDKRDDWKLAYHSSSAQLRSKLLD